MLLMLLDFQDSLDNLQGMKGQAIMVSICNKCNISQASFSLASLSILAAFTFGSCSGEEAPFEGINSAIEWEDNTQRILDRYPSLTSHADFSDWELVADSLRHFPHDQSSISSPASFDASYSQARDGIFPGLVLLEERIGAIKDVSEKYGHSGFDKISERIEAWKRKKAINPGPMWRSVEMEWRIHLESLLVRVSTTLLSPSGITGLDRAEIEAFLLEQKFNKVKENSDYNPAFATLPFLKRHDFEYANSFDDGDKTEVNVFSDSSGHVFAIWISVNTADKTNSETRTWLDSSSAQKVELCSVDTLRRCQTFPDVIPEICALIDPGIEKGLRAWIAETGAESSSGFQTKLNFPKDWGGGFTSRTLAIMTSQREDVETTFSCFLSMEPSVSIGVSSSELMNISENLKEIFSK